MKASATGKNKEKCRSRPALRVVVAPGGVAENVLQFVAPARRGPGVVEHGNPFVEGDAKRIVSLDIFGEAEADGVSGIFRLEGAEKLVPDDEGAAMVAVDVARIGTVVDAMVRRRVEDRFERAHRTNEFGVNPELIEQADGFHGHDHDGWKADDRKP